MTIEDRDIQDLDRAIHFALSDIALQLEEARADGVLISDPPQRYRLLQSYISTAIHGFAQSTVPRTADQICLWISKERDRRIDSGFEWNGHRFQSRASDRENILGAAQMALAAISAGAAEGYRWADPETDFEWILADNSKIPLSASDVLSLFRAGVEYKAALTFYARSLKDAVLAAEDPASVNVVEGWPFEPPLPVPVEA